jgi:hypothetical protein
MMHVHGQPPSGYPCSKLTYHIYGSMTDLNLWRTYKNANRGVTQ